MVWGCVTFFGMGTLAFINGNMNSEKYINTWTKTCLIRLGIDP
jgi:hypothetical protein